jgi:uracil-DNA glycosylase family 4
MSFDNLVNIEKKAKSKPKKKEVERGCSVCPLNKVPGIQKILGTIRGKKVAIFAQSPGGEENDAGKELVGPSGRWLWNELDRIGLYRDDCDVQNVCRCYPADATESSYETYLKMRNPSAEELRCCSIHTENALEKITANQILVFGQIAAKALLNVRSIPPNKIFWSDKLNARIYLLDHPAFFIRGYASEERLKAFRETLDVFAKDRGVRQKQLSDQYSFIREQDYRLVLNSSDAIEAQLIIRQSAYKGRRVTVDVEDAEISGKRYVIACGFSPKPGLSFVFIFMHKDQTDEDGDHVWAAARGLLEDERIKKAFHHGCSDVNKLAEEGVTVETFDHDTYLSEYLRFPDAKAYGLDPIAERRFPEFSGYKTIIAGDMLAGAELPPRLKSASKAMIYKYLVDQGKMDFSRLSLETMKLYNGADCDLTKRIEIENKKHVHPPLMRLYIDLSFILLDMEPNGPLFDFEQNAKLAELYPRKEKTLLAKLRKMTGRPEYNPGSHQQVYDVVYNQLGLEYPLKKGKPNTAKKTMLMLSREHKFPKLQVEWRGVSKAHSTYVVSYKMCAELNGGRLRTIWKLTGTGTGRLSSGRDRQKDAAKINLQNIHKDSHIQNQCVSDARWKTVYDAVLAIIESKLKGDKCEAVEGWVKKFMPDLKIFLILDYGQVEVRVFAQLSGDENLRADCMESDIHTRVGATLSGWPAEKIKNDKKTRTLTKNIHFGILFMLSKPNLYDFVVAMTDPEEQETVSREFVEDAYDRYFERYSKVKPFQDAQVEFAYEHRYVETAFHMRRPIEIRERSDEDEYGEDDDSDRKLVSWKAQAVNTPVQGTAHQLLECGLVNIRRKKEKYQVLGTPVLDVHDNLTFNVNVLDLHEAAKKARYLMEQESLNTARADFDDFEWDVPIVTEVEVGLSLGCRVDYEPGKRIGEVLIEWCRKRQKQMIDLDKQLEESAKGDLLSR